MKAMIFSAGFGTGMGQLTRDTPKPMLRLHDKPLIRHITDSLPPIDELVMNVHFLREKIENYFSSESFPFKVSFFREEKILGTGAGLYNAMPALKDSDFILHNCDVVTNLDWQEIKNFAETKKADIVLITNTKNTSKGLLFDEEGKLAGHFKEEHLRLVQGKTSENLRKLNFCGVSYFSKQGATLFERLKMKDFSLIDSFLKISDKGYCVQAFVTDPQKIIEVGDFNSFNSIANSPRKTFFSTAKP